MLGSMHYPNTTKGQEKFNLLVAFANRRMVGLTLLNSSGSVVCAPTMEYLHCVPEKWTTN